MEERFFVELPDGSRFGPVDLAMLREWIAQRRVVPETILVLEGTGERFRADARAGLFAESGAPPVVSPLAAPPVHAYVAPKRNTTSLVLILAIVGGAGLCVTAILAAVLLPVFSQAKYAAQKTRGLSNIKRLATGILIYSADADDHFPPAMGSAQALRPFLTADFVPADVYRTVNPQGGEILGDGRLSRGDASEIVDAAAAIMLYDRLAWPKGEAPVGYVDGHARVVRHATIAGLMKPDPFGGARRKPAPPAGG